MESWIGGPVCVPKDSGWKDEMKLDLDLDVDWKGALNGVWPF
ncbi:hypothetical protein ACIQK9_02405 [Streptomyces hydrogenans]